jgi:tetratricopeptide (TPR) repeat protein
MSAPARGGPGPRRRGRGPAVRAAAVTGTATAAMVAMLAAPAATARGQAVVPPAASEPAPPASGAALAAARRAALEALQAAGDAETRRDGVAGLAVAGTMEDVPVLVQALRDADPGVRGLAERALWAVWSRSGDEETDRLLAEGIEQMSGREGAAAVDTFTRVIERRPEFAEGWNKRATVYYLIGEYEKSLADCDEVMRRNPHHYGALSGYGMIHLQLGDPARALDYFERALAINPNLPQVEATVQMLRRLLIQRRRDST